MDNFSLQDEPWVEFSTLEVAAACILHLLSSVTIQPNLELKTQPKQLLGSLPLVIALSGGTLRVQACFMLARVRAALSLSLFLTLSLSDR